MRGSRAKALRKLGRALTEAEFANEVITKQTFRTGYVIDHNDMRGYKEVQVPMVLRQHHPKSFHNVVQILKASYRQFVKDGRPNEKFVGA